MEWRVVLVMKLTSATGCNKSSRGFTLIEILVVLIIIGIASSLIFLNFSSASSISKNQSSFQNAFNFLTEESIITGNIIGWHANNENEFSYILDYKKIPITTGESLGTNNANPFRTTSRQEVGIKLEVTPQINEGSSVVLQIKIEVSGVAGVPMSGIDIITNKRAIETMNSGKYVRVNDGSI